MRMLSLLPPSALSPSLLPLIAGSQEEGRLCPFLFVCYDRTDAESVYLTAGPHEEGRQCVAEGDRCVVAVCSGSLDDDSIVNTVPHCTAMQDHMRKAGDVCFAQVFKDGSGEMKARHTWQTVLVHSITWVFEDQPLSFFLARKRCTFRGLPDEPVTLSFCIVLSYVSLQSLKLCLRNRFCVCVRVCVCVRACMCVRLGLCATGMMGIVDYSNAEDMKYAVS